MSIIAKSLKKLSKKERASYKVELSTSRWIGSVEMGIYGIVGVIAVAVIVANFLFLDRVYVFTKEEFSKFPSVSKIESKIEVGKKFLRLTGKTVDFEYYLSIGDLKHLYAIARKYHNTKYEGIYFALTDRYNRALDLLKKYLKRNPQDVEAEMYLSKVYYDEGMYDESLNVLNQIKPNNYKICLDKGAVFEKMGRIKKAIYCYEKSLKMNPDYRIASKLKVKIVTLKFSLRSKSGF